MTRSTTRYLIKIILTVIIGLTIFGYALWRSLGYARGPEIDISYPSDGYATTSAIINISGRAQRINSISLNGSPITIDESGNFSETIIVFPGINNISLEAKDQFGRQTDTKLRIVGR